MKDAAKVNKCYPKEDKVDHYEGGKNGMNKAMFLILWQQMAVQSGRLRSFKACLYLCR